ncbi:protein-disulfide reductase DsbD [Ideonella sp. BN130291]|uniref:protein-disulfide reductase DsbD n=1 Tax=Ideonella sp. BN130291 TaxID=3112940 RepID=UPI002E262B72|nr:protein-disulfide reductase DsbD [Ideonella sp. BN130291]
MSSSVLRLVLLLVSLWSAWRPAFADDFLEPEKAFQIAVRAADERTVEVSYRIAPGYYMYREQFKFSADAATLGEPAFPRGKVKFDETFQKNVETFRDEVRVRVPVAQAGASFRLTAIGQGCADQGLCYPPMPSVADVRLAGFGGDGSARVLATGDAVANLAAVQSSTPVVGAAPRSTPPTAPSTDDSMLDRALQGGGFWTVLFVFFGAGVLLSLTPCVLPMLPILSSIIAGGTCPDAKRGRGLMLAGSYSLGMALVYTLFGIAAGLAGEGLAAALQTPAVLGGFALLLVLLSLSMFGVYELRLPSAITCRLANASHRVQGGRMAGVFVMGGLSALIVSPCVAAPLAGALVYLSQTRDVLLGGAALFALALGMSVPLLLVGASAGALLPKAGPWMEGIKQFFGLLLLAVAIWMIQPLLPAALTLAAWGVLLALASALLRPFSRQHRGRFTVAVAAKRVLGVLAGVFALLQFVGAASGGSNPLQPLAHLVPGQGGAASALPFQAVHSVAELDAAVAAAGRPVMLDFYADWCVSCKEMERFTFTDAHVQRQLAGALLLKADVTHNTAEDRELLRRFKLFGPPGTIFFDAQGREMRNLRVVGFQNAERFSQTLRAAGL